MSEAAKKETKPTAAKASAKSSSSTKASKTQADMFSEAPKAKTEAKKQPVSAGSVKVTQIQGTIARKWDQEATLRGLGLGKRHKSRVLQDTPEIRGMIYKVRHLVKVEKAS